LRILVLINDAKMCALLPNGNLQRF
jgi:hypothetical protein